LAPCWAREKSNPRLPRALFACLGTVKPIVGEPRNVCFPCLIKKVTFGGKKIHKGFLNSVSYSLLDTYFKSHPKLTTLNLLNKKSSLQKLFWKSHIFSIADEINTYLQNAQAALNQLEHLQIINDRKYFEKLLKPLKQSTQQIISNQKEIGSFLTSFQS
jgi:hypothetical protein